MPANKKEPVGPATETHLPRITVKGNSYQRGFQYGRDLKRHLEGFYYWFVGREPSEVLTAEYRAVLDEMEQMTSEHFPQLLDEVRGQADGSGLPYDMCRIMAFHNEITNVLQPGCSNVVVTRGPEGPWLARNCDLVVDERPWQIVKIAHCDDCFCYAGVGYLGSPGVRGLNEAGLANGGASSPSTPPEKLQGMPNISYYLLATQDTVEKCCRQVQSLGFLGKGVNLPLLDAAGEAVVLELGAGVVSIRRPDESGLLAATNHSVSGEIPRRLPVDEESYENSTTRYNRLMEIGGNADPEERTTDLAKKVMADHENKWPICRHPEGRPNTIYSTVATTAEGRRSLEVCWGNPCRGNFEIVKSFQ